MFLFYCAYIKYSSKAFAYASLKTSLRCQKFIISPMLCTNQNKGQYNGCKFPWSASLKV